MPPSTFDVNWLQI